MKVFPWWPCRSAEARGALAAPARNVSTLCCRTTTRSANGSALRPRSALLIGSSTLPGAFIAKRLTRNLSLRAHTYILDAAVLVGGSLLLWQGLRG